MRSMGATRIRAFDHVAMRAARERKKWSRGRLAVQLGLTPPAVTSWERGTTTPEPPTFVLLAMALDVEPADLIATPRSGWTLAEYRVTRGFHQAPAAEQIGIPTSRLSNFEMGYEEPREGIDEAIAQLYGVTVEDIHRAWQCSRDRLLAQ